MSRVGGWVSYSSRWCGSWRRHELPALLATFAREPSIEVQLMHRQLRRIE